MTSNLCTKLQALLEKELVALLTSDLPPSQPLLRLGNLPNLMWLQPQMMCLASSLREAICGLRGLAAGLFGCW